MLPEDVSKVQDIIAKADLELKSIEVNKKIPLDIDMGNLLVSDINELDKTRFRNPAEQSDYFKELARDGVQALLNKVWDLPSDTINNAIYAILPKTTYRLPREKPIPKPKPPTKWEIYAKEKGIKKKKKANKEWDDVIKEWVPRYGYRKVAAERQKNWMMEVPDNANPYEDQFAKAAEAKQERIAKNEYLRLKNIAKAKNVQVPSLGVTATNMSSSSAMGTALSQARVSTASLGKFQKTLRADKPLVETTVKKGQKRKLPTNDTSVKGIQQDKKRALDVLGKIKKSDLDYEGAVNKQLKLENIKNSHQGRKEPKSKRRSKQGKGQGKKRGDPKRGTRGKRVLAGNLANKKKSEGKSEKGGRGGKGGKGGGRKAGGPKGGHKAGGPKGGYRAVGQKGKSQKKGGKKRN